MRNISRFIYFITGWKAVGYVPKEITKAVFLVAPHTSTLDFYIGRLYCWINRLPMKVMVKKEAFKGPLGSLLKKVGGMPIDRSKTSNKVNQIVRMFNENDNMLLTIAPEGTRKLNPNWKMGFYYIALQAKVPILLSFIDYEKKQRGLDHLFTHPETLKKILRRLRIFIAIKGLNTQKDLI